MWSFGHQNWIRYGWGDKFSSEFNGKDNLHIDFRNYAVPSVKLRAMDAALLTIETITRTYPPPYTLMCSGGIDSQAMLWAWKCSGVPFTLLSARYVSNGIFFNEHDTYMLSKFSEVHSIPINFKVFDVVHFLENELAEIAQKYQSGSPQVSTHIKLTDFVTEGTIIFSGNYIIKYHNRDMAWLNWVILAMQRYSDYLKKTNSPKQVVPYFFLHRPELAYGFEPGPSTRNYELNGFPVLQPEQKYTGFEKLKEYYDQFYDRVPPKTRLMYQSMPSKRAFDLLFRYPYGINMIENPIFYLLKL